MKILYRAHATAKGGRAGHVESSDGVLKLDLAMPRELGGDGRAATNPEQLFAAGYSACFDSALHHVARMQKVAIASSEVSAEVGIGQREEGGFGLAVALSVKLAGVDQAAAEALVQAAHAVCPYSNATRGNIEVTLNTTAV